MAGQSIIWVQNISIHAPREGSDTPRRSGRAEKPHFYPRSPRGERHRANRTDEEYYTISIHAPREGSDVSGA